jgi:hypothetical protein
MQNKYGNNIECDYIKKIRVPIFDQQGQTDNGTRYYFPESPQIDNNLVVGIEAHIQQGDLNVDNLATLGLAKQLFFSFYDKDKQEIFYNVPYFSLFGRPNAPYKRRIKPYFNKINCKMCYVFVPANSTVNLSKQIYADLTFFLRKPTN